MTSLAALLILISPSVEFKAQALKEGVPDGVAPALRKELASEGIRVLSSEGKPHMDFWFRKTVPTVEPVNQLGVSFGGLKQGTLIGVVRVHAEGADYRGHKYAAGVYTMRYAWRPEDGDHQGTTDTRDFLCLVGPADDTAVAPLEEKKLHELSKKVSSKKHPAVLYLVKWFRKADALPHVFQNEENENWLVEVEVPSTKEGNPLRFWIVVEGEAPEF